MTLNSIWKSFLPENRWYNRGWEKLETFDEKGRFRQSFRYVGEYYAIKPKDKRNRCRITVGLCTLLMLAVYAAASLLGTVGSRAKWIAIPMAMTMLPMMYFCMGAFWYVISPERLTFRRYYASEQRLKRAAWLTILCLLGTAVGEIVLLVRYAGRIQIGTELLFLGAVLLCGALSGKVLLTLRRCPMKMTK